PQGDRRPRAGAVRRGRYRRPVGDASARRGDAGGSHHHPASRTSRRRRPREPSGGSLAAALCPAGRPGGGRVRVPWRRCLTGIIEREFLRFLRQRGRFFASLVRPLVWLVLFAAGLRSLLVLPPMPPYPAGVSYEDYIVPGLVGLILLFNGMQTALSMVFDREMGSMKVLLVSPLPRWY